MRIAAYDSHAWKRGALLRSDYVNNTLADVVHPELGNIQFFTVLVERLHLNTRYGIADAMAAPGGRHVMVSHGENGISPPGLAPGQLQPFERLRTGDFMHQMAVDIKQYGIAVFMMFVRLIRLIGFLVNHVALPELVV